MRTVFLKAFVIWLLLLALAILNAGIREKLLASWFGPQLALPLSGLSLSLLIFLVTLLVAPLLKARKAVHYWMVGAIWLAMTISFEFLFGHLVIGHSWAKLLEAYNVSTGNLWLLVLLVTAVSPYLAARARGLLTP